MQALFRAEEPNHPRRIIRVIEWKIIRCPETGPSKQASLRNSARSLIERRAEPLGNLNKGLPSAPRVAYPLMRHVHASHHITSHHITSHHITSHHSPWGGWRPPWSRNWGASPYFIPFPPPRGTPAVASPTDKEPGTGRPPLLSGHLRALGGDGAAPRYRLGGPPLSSPHTLPTSDL